MAWKDLELWIRSETSTIIYQGFHVGCLYGDLCILFLERLALFFPYVNTYILVAAKLYTS